MYIIPQSKSSAVAGGAAGICTRALMKSLSDDAKIILGGYFGMMTPGKGELVFHMQEVRPTKRAQRALDELVAAGAISREPFNRLGGVRYRPLVNCSEFFSWIGRNKSKGKWATEPVAKSTGRSQ